MNPRRLTRHPVPQPGPNSLQHWTRAVPAWRVMRNFAVIYAARFLPSLTLKRWLYRSIGMRVGKNVSVGLGVVFDIFWPELISIGDDTIIGFNSTVLAHEFLIEEYRTGPVEIGSRVMIGANCTILAGVQVGDGATVFAMSLVNRDVPAGARVAGIPARPLPE